MDLTTLLPLGVWRLNKLFTLFLKCHPKVHSNTSKSWHLFTFVSHASSVVLSYTRYPTPYGCRDFYNSCTKLTLSRSIYNFYCYTFIWYRYVLVYLFAEANAPQIRHIASGLTLRAWSSLNDLHNCSAKPQRTTEIRIFLCVVLLPATQAMPCRDSCVYWARPSTSATGVSDAATQPCRHIQTQRLTLEIYSDLFSGNIAVRLPIHSRVRVGKGSLRKLPVAACWCLAGNRCICSLACHSLLLLLLS